jgi:hypothetical protein
MLRTSENHLGPSLEYSYMEDDLRELYAQTVFIFWTTFVVLSRNMTQIRIMIVRCCCCVLFELLKGPCTSVQSNADIYSLVFVSWAVGQIELTWVQNGPFGFWKKKLRTKKTEYSLINGHFMSRGRQRTIGKIVQILLYTTENCLRKDQAWVHFLPSQ